MPAPAPEKRLTPAAAISPGGLLHHDFRGPSWDRWRAVLKAAYAEPLTADELVLFKEVAGDRDPPTRPVRELWVVAGRRAGKDSIAAGIATVAALDDYKPYLRTGERATVMCLASDRQQAAIVHRYIAGYFRDLPALAPLVQREADDTLELRNSVEILVATNNLRAPRGRAIAVAILDEIAYWRGAESASPDTETFNAIEPATMTIPNALIIGITSPYRRSGLVFQKWTKHFGKNDDDILVVRGTSKQFNPTLPDHIIEARLAADPEAGGAEYLAEWRSDIGDFLDLALVQSVVDTGVAVRPPQLGAEYGMFVDASGGRGSSFGAAISHTEGDRVIVDAVFERLAPFNPRSAVKDVTMLARAYRIGSITGDRYGAEWVVEAFAAEGLTYTSSEKDKSALFLEALPLFSAGRISLPDNPRLVHQLSTLERVTTKLGRDRVGCPTGGSDDLANAVCGAAINAVGNGPVLVKHASVFANAVPMPTVAILATSMSVIGPDGLVGTAFFSHNARILGAAVDETILLDVSLTPFNAAAIPTIAARLAELRAAIASPQQIGAYQMLHVVPALLQAAEAAGYDVEVFEPTVLADLPGVAVQFAGWINSGIFKIAESVTAKSRELPIAGALTFRPGERIDDNTLKMVILQGARELLQSV